MLVEDCLAGNREPGAIAMGDTVRFATTKPESVAGIQVADVTHAMPNLIPIADLVHGVLVTADDILSRDHRAGDHQLADLASRHLHRL